MSWTDNLNLIHIFRLKAHVTQLVCVQGGGGGSLVITIRPIIAAAHSADQQCNLTSKALSCIALRLRRTSPTTEISLGHRLHSTLHSKPHLPLQAAVCNLPHNVSNQKCFHLAQYQSTRKAHTWTYKGDVLLTREIRQSLRITTIISMQLAISFNTLQYHTIPVVCLVSIKGQIQ